MYEILLESNYTESIEREYEDIEVTEEDVRQIELLAKDPEIYDKLIRSMSPSIRGKNKIKEAMVLQMFGGVRKERKDGTKSRGDIHILLIGDPGTGKSQLVKSMAAIAPKARFVSGKGATGAGLTATVVKDEILKGWALEAGALVLANRGILCIDEIDKMSTEDRAAMHEALEQQTISISKANIQATLIARTTVLAAANPKFGRFDPYQSIAQQIDLPPTLINRFDVIFTLRDIPNRDKDERIARHILLEHQKQGSEMIIEKGIFQKYVAYAKQRIKPFLSQEAVEEIKKFYVELRNVPISSESAMRPIPISARQLQALIRMAEASAKLRLDEKVTIEDAKKAIELVKYYLMQVGYDYETKTFDIDKISSRFSSSQRGKVFTVRDVISDLANKVGELIPVEEIEKELEGKMSKEEITDAITELEKNSIISG